MEVDVGFNMSWIFVDGISEDTLYEALGLAATGETPDPHDLGTSYVPLAGAALKSGWSAVFAKYALVMDATVGTNPARLTRLPARSRCITCVVLEHAMVSYASLWQDGRFAWQIRHDSSEGRGHLEVRGDLPSAFGDFRAIAMDKQRTEDARRKSGEWGVNYFFDVPLDTAATITGYRHDRAIESDFFRNLRTLVPTNGNVLTKLSQPPGWWQTLRSIEYE
jgi:hypothetical protein